MSSSAPQDLVPRRTQIRHAVRALLKDNTSAAERVYASRAQAAPHPEYGEAVEDFYPRINVYTGDDLLELDEPYSEDPLVLVRNVELEVEILHKAAAEVDVDDEVDRIERACIEALLLSRSMGGDRSVRYLDLPFVLELFPLSSTLVLDEDGDSPSGSRVVTFGVRYEEVHGFHSDVDLARIDVDWETDANRPGPEAEDQIDLEVDP